jgi:hypothetical protein
VESVRIIISRSNQRSTVSLFLINLTTYSKLGVPIKTTISPTVLEEAMNGTVTVRPLPVGTSATGKVLILPVLVRNIYNVVVILYLFYL